MNPENLPYAQLVMYVEYRAELARQAASMTNRIVRAGNVAGRLVRDTGHLASWVANVNDFMVLWFEFGAFLAPPANVANRIYTGGAIRGRSRAALLDMLGPIIQHEQNETALKYQARHVLEDRINALRMRRNEPPITYPELRELY